MKDLKKEEEIQEEQPPYVPEGVIPDKNTAFKLYKYESQYSKDTEKQMKEDIEKLKEQKNTARELLEKSKERKRKTKKRINFQQRVYPVKN